MRTSSLFAFVLSIALCAPALNAQMAQAGQQLFASNCAGCHGLDGRGGEHAPDIATKLEVQRLDDAEILRIVYNGIPEAGMPAFRAVLNNDQMQAVVGYLRVLQGKGTQAVISGNPEKGRTLFFGKGQCSECHMIAGHGGSIAADLSGYGADHSPEAIRNAIVDPNKNADRQHGTVVVITRDGQKFTGVALNEDNFSLQLQTLDGKFHLFDKSQLVHVEHERRSLMPSNYGLMLSRGDLDDLITFLTKTAPSQPLKTRGEDEE